MLITFSCDAYENITMFGDVALRLIKLMGHSGTVPSALLWEQIPEALTELKHALTQEKTRLTEAGSSKVEDKDKEHDVSLSHRALPLIALLEAAEKKKCNVMWCYVGHRKNVSD